MLHLLGEKNQKINLQVKLACNSSLPDSDHIIFLLTEQASWRFLLREITKSISVQVDRKPKDFRLTKLDAFSGVFLLRLMTRLPEKGASVEALLSGLSDGEIRSLMTTCLQHCEVLLPAGWMPVMTRGEWSFPELEHDTAVCLRLTIEEVLWTLSGFFAGGGLTSRSETPAS